jgi:hypothetical protein
MDDKPASVAARVLSDAERNEQRMTVYRTSLRRRGQLSMVAAVLWIFAALRLPGWVGVVPIVLVLSGVASFVLYTRARHLTEPPVERWGPAARAFDLVVLPAALIAAVILIVAHLLGR